MLVQGQHLQTSRALAGQLHGGAPDPILVEASLAAEKQPGKHIAPTTASATTVANAVTTTSTTSSTSSAP